MSKTFGLILYSLTHSAAISSGSLGIEDFSCSIFSTVKTSGGISGSVIFTGVAGGTSSQFWLCRTSGCTLAMYAASGGLEFGIADTPYMWMDGSGYVYNNTQIRSPIYYDYNNTGYYAQPSYISVFNQLNLDSSSS